MDIDFAKIKKLNQEIKNLLEEKPELAEFQKEIDIILKKVGKKNRMAMLQSLMLDKFLEMNEKLQELSEITKVFKK